MSQPSRFSAARDQATSPKTDFLPFDYRLTPDRLIVANHRPGINPDSAVALGPAERIVGRAGASGPRYFGGGVKWHGGVLRGKYAELAYLAGSRNYLRFLTSFH